MTSQKQNLPTLFPETMKMSRLIEDTPDLLTVVGRMGIPLPFGEANVAEVCRRSGVDTHTFLLICSVYAHERFIPTQRMLRDVRLEDLLRYLRASHRYYVETSLVALKQDLQTLLQPAPEAKQNVIRRFFNDYSQHLAEHFDFEENTVFPFVEELIRDGARPGQTLGLDEEDHTSIDEKLSDLKSILMKYLPEECDPEALVPLLKGLSTLSDDLRHHTAIEENILDPVVKHVPMAPDSSRSPEEEESGDLSAREKEILVCVAKGMLNKEIADHFSISIYTVISHRKNITRKTGIKTVAGLTVYALLNGLIDISSVE